MSPIPPKVREAVTERSGGVCERCGIAPAAEQHHRRPRGMGSTKRPESNLPGNLLALCANCHRWVENNRTKAYCDGLLLGQNETPSLAAVSYRGTLVLLKDDGCIEFVEDQL